jgi:DNA (cytosine-5)-methyltransferase 1
MKFGSLFSGIGGFDLGFERAGMQCVWQSEIYPPARRLLKRHYPNVQLKGDIQFERFEAVDLICRGFPCQDVSTAGRRAGLVGERSGLWFAFLDVLQRNKPEWVVIENVPGLLSSNAGRDFATILYGLGECGYRVAWRVLNSQYFGVPQRRRRVFIVGHLGDGRAAEVLFERESGEGYSRPRQETQKDAPTVIGTLLASGAGSARSGGNRNEVDLLIPTNNGIPQVKSFNCLPQTLFRHNDYANYTVDTNSSALRAQARHHSDLVVIALDSRNMQSSLIVGTLHQNPLNVYYSQDFNQDRIYSSSGIAPALTASDSAKSRRILTSFGVRRLTPLECERLQGFPDDWTAGESDTARYAVLGNAVTVPVAQWLGERIMACRH